VTGAAAAAGLAHGDHLPERGGSTGDGGSNLTIGDTPAEADNHPISVKERDGELQVKIIITFV
jgi:hypothetical protein